MLPVRQTSTLAAYSTRLTVADAYTELDPHLSSSVMIDRHSPSLALIPGVFATVN
jgi:hypothetical protein